MKITFLLLATFIIIFFIFGAFALVDLIKINIITVQSEDKMIAAAWSGFSEIDLNKLAVRNNIEDEENRDIYLDKVKAENIIRQYIKYNFRLDDLYMPKEDSFINSKDHPLIIEKLEIYNPDDYTSSTITIKGKNINRTSIYIYFKVPIEFSFIGTLYKELHIVVDSKTFYSTNQQ